MTFDPTKPDRAAWLKGGEVHCNVSPTIPAHPRRLVLLGAPGVGKGTQAELISRRLGTCHLSTGDVFRDAKKSKDCEPSPAMHRALEFMRRGELVPDEIILNLIVERSRCLRCKGGFLLDGFPRTAAQAEVLDRLMTTNDIKLDAVINYDLPIETIVARLSGRRVCVGCNAVFHVSQRPPKKADICDQCGGRLIQREDDKPECVRVRMEKYLEQTAPLFNFYKPKGVLISINAEGSPEEIFERTITALQQIEA